MDHVRVVYYPSYSRVELRGGSLNSVTLDLPKAVGVVKEALAIYKAGYHTPVPESLNANPYDRFFAALNKATGNLALAMRTDDYDWNGPPPPKACTTYNSVEGLIWGSGKGVTTACPWYGPVPQLTREYDL